jgi:hypothetical protein
MDGRLEGWNGPRTIDGGRWTQLEVWKGEGWKAGIDRGRLTVDDGALCHADRGGNVVLHPSRTGIILVTKFCESDQFSQSNEYRQ